MTDEIEKEETTTPKEEPKKTANLTSLAEQSKPTEEELKEKEPKVFDDKDEPKKIKVEKPEGLPEELWDAENNMLVEDKVLAELDKQTKIATDLRKRMSKGLKADVPEKAEDYVISIDKELSDLKIGEDEKGKMVFNELKTIAFKNNMSQSQMDGFINDYFKMLIDKGIVDKPLTEAEQKLEQQKYETEQKSKLGDNAEKLITGNVQWIEQIYKQGLISETEKEKSIKLMDESAENVLLFDKFRKMAGEPDLPRTNVKVEGLPSDEEIARGMKEHKYSDTELQKIMEKRYKSGKTESISAKYF